MARSSKFSILSSRKKGNKSKGATETDAVANTTKVERLLGATGTLNVDPTLRTRPAAGPSKLGAPPAVGRTIPPTSYRKRDELDFDDADSAVLPRESIYGATPSIAGSRYLGDETATYASSSRNMRHANSNSTLNSFYDRHKAGLLVSQQTSASSSRDMALRKGVTTVTDAPQHDGRPPSTYQGSTSERSKKNSLFGLAGLFPKPRKEPPNLLSPSHVTASPSMLSLASTASKSSNLGQDTTWKRPQKKDSLNHLYDHYESMPPRAANGRFQQAIPEEAPLELPEHDHEGVSLSQSFLQDPGLQPSSPGGSRSIDIASIDWPHPNAELPKPPRPWDAQSTASLSSHATKTSRRSIFSSDLQQNSVLSLSSDDESDDESTNPTMSTAPSSYYTNRLPITRPESMRSVSSTVSSLPPEQPVPRTQSVRTSHRSSKKAAQSSNLLTIPEPKRINPRISGPWGPRSTPDNESLTPRDSQALNKRVSVSTTASSRVSSPPASPNSSRDARLLPGKTNRYMAVTRQEEALLEALRQKRAMMRENIVADGDKFERGELAPPTRPLPPVPLKNPSRVIDRTMKSRQARQLYISEPAAEDDRAEPSPDLSDFLTNGSDADSTPRSSMMPPPDPVRESIRYPGRDYSRPPTPPLNPARLSAVGAAGGFRMDGRKRMPHIAVRFAHEVDRESTRSSSEFFEDMNGMI